MPPLEFSASESFDPTSSVSRGAEGLAREVQTQVSNAAANIGLDKLSMPMPGADSALGLAGAPVGANEALSPLMNIITKMPGHIGLFSSFFEMLGSFFAPQMELLNGIDFSGLGGIFSPDHFALDLSLLPDDAPFLSTLDSSHVLNFGQSDLLSNKLNFALGQSSSLGASKELLFRPNMNVSGNLLGKPQFEGAGVLSGPNMAQGVQANHIAGNNRLFADSLGGNQNNMLAQSNTLPTAATAQATSLNVSGNGLTIQTGSGTSAAGGLGDFKAAGNPQELIAANTDNFQSQITAPRAETGLTNNADLGGMKARAISLDGKAMPEVKHGLDKAVSAKELPVDKVAAKAQPAIKHHAVKHSGTTTAANSHNTGHSNTSHKVAEVKAESTKAEIKAETKTEIAQEVKGDAGQMQNQLDAQNGTHSYTIKAGDNLWNIAKDNLGQATKWSDIYKMNSDVLGANPELIRPGTTIQLPGAAPDVNVAANYTVKPGDNLFDIAKNQLGDSSKWGELYKANEGVIGSNPSLIRPGTELNLGGAQAQPVTLAQAPAAPQMAAPAQPVQTAMVSQPAVQMQMPASGGETIQGFNLEAQPAANNFESMQFEPAKAVEMPNNGLKVVPAKAAPDMIIPPAHAAEASSFANFETITLNGAAKPSAVNSTIGNDLMSFLSKRK